MDKAIDNDTGHIKITRVFRASIITQLNRIHRSFLTLNEAYISLTRSVIKKYWNMFTLSDDISLHIYTLFQEFMYNFLILMISISIFHDFPVTHSEDSYHHCLCDIWIRFKLA